MARFPDIATLSRRIIDMVAPFQPIDSVVDAKLRHRADLDNFTHIRDAHVAEMADRLRRNDIMANIDPTADSIGSAQQQLTELKEKGPTLLGRRRLFGRIPLWKSGMEVSRLNN